MTEKANRHHGTTAYALHASFSYELRADDRATLQRVAALVQELARESHQGHEGSHPPVVTELHAAATDLRYVGGFLHQIASQAGELSSTEETRLAVMAEDWVPLVSDLAGEIEAAIPTNLLG